MKHTKNLTKRHMRSRIRNTSVIFWNYLRTTVKTVVKWFKKRHSGIFCTFTTSLKFFSTTASAKRSVSMKSKSVKNIGSIGGRFATTIGILAATAALLTACGGGGGSATDPVFVNPPPVIVTPALSIIASPVIPSIDGKTGVSTNVAAVISAEFTPVNFTNPTAAMFSAATSTGATFSCGGVKVNSGIFSPFSITQVTGTAKFTVTSSFSMTGLPALTNCIFSLPLTITGGGVASNPVTIGFSFTTAAAPVACAAPTVSAKLGSTTVCANPVGTKVLDLKKIPTGCAETSHNPKDQCFQDFIPQVKWLQTPARATGAAVSPVTGIANDGPVLFGCYIDKWDNTQCDIFLADTGTVFANGGVNLTTQHFTLQREWTAPTAKGEIHRLTPEGKCYELSWFPPTTQVGVNSNTWANIETTCPAL